MIAITCPGKPGRPLTRAIHASNTPRAGHEILSGSNTNDHSTGQTNCNAPNSPKSGSGGGSGGGGGGASKRSVSIAGRMVNYWVAEPKKQ